MVMLHPEFVIDKDKRTKAVLLPFLEWENVLAELEELDDIREYDTARSSAEESIPFAQAVSEIRQNYRRAIPIDCGASLSCSIQFLYYTIKWESK